jgi:small subunit ribosomal protein S8
MDTIADMLTQIRNAQMAGHREVEIKSSKLKVALAGILEKEGFIEKTFQESKDNFNKIRLVLKYYNDSSAGKSPAIKGIRKISRVGQRIYMKNKDIRSVKNKFGIAIISTSKGVMTDYEARKEGVGGEYICEVW